MERVVIPVELLDWDDVAEEVLETEMDETKELELLLELDEETELVDGVLEAEDVDDEVVEDAAPVVEVEALLVVVDVACKVAR